VKVDSAWSSVNADDIHIFHMICIIFIILWFRSTCL